MNVKTMRRDEWSSILEKKVMIENFDYGELKGKISFLKILKVSSPIYIGEERLAVADVNHTWIQIAFDNQFFWFTVMFDANDRLFGIYVDMTDGNVVDVDNPYFADMYLDYVIKDEMVLELDRNELDEALINGAISEEQYERTIAEGKKIFGYLKDNKEELKNWLENKLQELKLKLN